MAANRWIAAAAAGIAVAGMCGTASASSQSAKPPGGASGVAAAAVSAAAPASLSSCQSRARQARTFCTPGPVIAGSRCTVSQSGWFSLTSTRSLVTCKRSWGTVYTWVWA